VSCRPCRSRQKTGQGTIEATIIAVTTESIRVRRASGGESTIPLANLDQDSLIRVIGFCDQSATAISPEGYGADVSQMLSGATDLPVPGLPGTLAVFGRSAFPVLTMRNLQEQKLSNVLAAARIGRGPHANVRAVPRRGVREKVTRAKQFYIIARLGPRKTIES